MALIEFILPNNVVKVAQFILEMDQSLIDERHRPDLKAAIYWLKDSLDHYLHPHARGGMTSLSAIDQTEFALRTLMEAVRSLVVCLNPDGQAQLRQFLLATSFPRMVAS